MSIEGMIKGPIVLKGKAAQDFDRYNSRPATKSELKLMRDAERFYAQHPVKEDHQCAKKAVRK